MPVSKITIILIVFVLTLSVFVANISNLISVMEKNPSRRMEDTETNVDQSEATKLTLGNSPEHLMWFIQISDIHISIFHDETRVTELKEFCDLTLNAVKPTVVLASGDLTDAKSEDNMGSRQYVQEWELYKEFLESCKVTEKTVWLDIRGNHDNFNVPGLTSKENYYRNYSMQGRAHPKSYMYQTKKGGELYSFIGMDACLEPGPRRPFNFVGVLSQAEMDHVKKLSDDAKRKGSNHTIWFGHYPTSCILAPGSGGVRTLIAKYSESIVYVCGHYHTLGGMVPNMYTLQQAGFLELELGDWKDNRLYRLLAVDHGLFSFVDIKHRDWPVVLVTNPKHALFIIPTREPLQRILQSTHIRVLGFSLSPIESVEVKVDDGVWQHCTHIRGPLYVHPWDPNLFATGIHEIHVLIKDKAGREKVITQPFSLDGTQMSFRLFPRLVLMSNISLVFQFLFGTMLTVCILPLCILKYLHKLVKAEKLHKPRLSVCFFQNWVRKLWILSTVDRVFYPLVLYALYLTVRGQLEKLLKGIQGSYSLGEQSSMAHTFRDLLLMHMASCRCVHFNFH
ncbi:transmembrane protein 62-like isoform X2 [Zootermopsis nevadensis]|uniref:transmembrane protein 62-like isoform X2 n=1 Tax=Zootermopsis nevadensis TaxID=136037 RepID=UPI000B8EA28E|nr:transmembrane protein 62-like isoform X2 [Zootermopsis nevadensis]XP_021929538.1 transmembrane protein 62-like isoform X2 [Zootermopsis nevadensis]